MEELFHFVRMTLDVDYHLIGCLSHTMTHIRMQCVNFFESRMKCVDRTPLADVDIPDIFLFP